MFKAIKAEHFLQRTTLVISLHWVSELSLCIARNTCGSKDTEVIQT